MASKGIAAIRRAPAPPVIARETVGWDDYLAGAAYVVLGTALIVALGWFYWMAHGGNLEGFAFWSTGDKKWLEVLFWSFFTAHAWNMADVATWMADNTLPNSFQKRYVWGYIAHTFEAPPVSLALVFVLINVGVAFGDTTVSLQEVPIFVVIAFAIISAYFSRETINTLQEVAQWFVDQVQAKLPPVQGASGGSATKS